MVAVITCYEDSIATHCSLPHSVVVVDVCLRLIDLQSIDQWALFVLVSQVDSSTAVRDCKISLNRLEVMNRL